MMLENYIKLIIDLISRIELFKQKNNFCYIYKYNRYYNT